MWLRLLWNECLSCRWINRKENDNIINPIFLESFVKLAEDRWTNGTSKHAYQEHKCWVKAIEIVKQGGVADDVCEWKYPIDIFDNVEFEVWCN